MVYHNGQGYYRSTEITSKFRKKIDKDITWKETRSILKMLKFPHVKVMELYNGKQSPANYYDVGYVEDMLYYKSKRDMIMDTLKEIRRTKKAEKENGDLSKSFSRTHVDPELPLFGERTRKKYEERKRTEMERRKAEMNKRLSRIEDENELDFPETRMDYVSDEYLRNDDVYGFNESLNNVDYPLYHFTTLESFRNIAETDSMVSDYHGSDEAIIFTRNKYYHDESSAVRMRFNADKLMKSARNLRLAPHGQETEMLKSRHKGKFTLNDVSGCVDETYIVLDEICALVNDEATIREAIGLISDVYRYHMEFNVKYVDNLRETNEFSLKEAIRYVIDNS